MLHKIVQNSMIPVFTFSTPFKIWNIVIKFVSMTVAEYKALETKSPSTIYHLTDVSMWAIGDQEIVTSNMPA